MEDQQPAFPRTEGDGEANSDSTTARASDNWYRDCVTDDCAEWKLLLGPTSALAALLAGAVGVALVVVGSGSWRSRLAILAAGTVGWTLAAYLAFMAGLAATS